MSTLAAKLADSGLAPLPGDNNATGNGLTIQIADRGPPDYLAQLRGICTRMRRKQPRYTLESETDSVYTFAVYSGTRKLGSGYGSSHGEAKMHAAQTAITQLEQSEAAVDPTQKVQKKKVRKTRKQRKEERNQRKSKRGADQGREFEHTVSAYLQELVDKGELSSFEYHEPNSEADQQGKDFTVHKGIQNVSFGVTISRTSAERARCKHPGVPVFCFPHNTKPETIHKRVLELFEAQE